ncbi:hypothetical protein, partial [Xanthomonas citri]|uniref:hypothetical protein n=1 Tax=Xanthomonas citri TaxID=346 RepID=UPI0015E1887E
ATGDGADALYALPRERFAHGKQLSWLRDRANQDSLSLPVGILTVVAGGALTMARSVDIEHPASKLGLSIALAVTAVLLLCNLFCLAKSLVRYKYSHAPDMLEWLGDREHFEHEYREKWRGLGITKSRAEQEARREFYYHLDQTYAKSASNNSIQNKKKAEWIALGHRFLIASVGSLMLAGVFFSLSPTKPADDVAPKSLKDAKKVITPSKPEKPANSPASLPSTTAKDIKRPPVRDPMVINEKFPQKDHDFGLDDL